MRLLIWLLFILGVAVALSLLVGSNDGYVLLVQPPYRIELSLNLMVIMLVVGFTVLYGAVRLVQYTLRLPDNVRRFKQNRRQKKANASLLESLQALAEGRYAKAETAAARALELGENAGLSALIAARAAHKNKRPEKSDFYLAEVERLAPELNVARLLAQAELQLDKRDYAHALQTLLQLEKIEPHHTHALQMQLKAQQRLGNWEQVLQVLAQLEKRGAIEPEHLRQVRLHAHQKMLERRKGHREDLLAYWKKIPEPDRLQPKLAKLAASNFLAVGDGATAATIVEKCLTNQWDDDLAALYGDCAGSDPRKQLQQAEYWLQSHHGDASLLLSLASLCIRQELWGKAQSYLDASLSVQPSGAAHLIMARLQEHMGNQEEAYRHYRKSLEYALAQVPV